MKKKVILLLILVILLQSTIVLAANSFKDLNTDSWAYQYVSELKDKNIINGYPDGTFRPNGNVTRAEFVKMLASTLDVELTIPTMQTFADVSRNDWEYIYVENLKSYLTGFKGDDGNLYFRGDNFAVREDMTVAMVKSLGLENYQLKNDNINEVFKDSDQISDSLKLYVLIAYENNLISGYPDGTFRPQQKLTRAETAALICRFAVTYEEKVIVEPEIPQFKLIDKSYIDLTKDYGKYEFAYSYDKYSPGRWYEPTSSKIRVTKEINSGTYAFVREIGKLNYTTIQFRVENPKYELDYNNECLYVDTGTMYRINTGNTSAVITGKIDLSEYFNKMRLNSDFDVFIDIYNKDTKYLLKSDTIRIRIDRNKIKEITLPSFVDKSYVDFTEQYGKYEFSYNTSNKPGNWYKPASRNMELKKGTTFNNEVQISYYSNYVFVRETGKKDYTTLQIRNKKPNYELDYENSCIYIDTGAYYKLEEDLTYAIQIIKADTLVTNRKVDLTDVLEYVSNEPDSAYYIRIYNPETDTLLSSLDVRLKLEEEEIEEELPEFEFINKSYIDLTEDYAKYEFSHSTNKSPTKWYTPKTRNVPVFSNEGINSGTYAFVRQVGKTEYATIQLRNDYVDYEMDYENSCIYIDEGARYVITGRDIQTRAESTLVSETTVTSRKIDLTEFFDKLLNDSNLQINIQMYNPETTSLLKSESKSITLNREKIPTGLPEFKFVNKSYVDLTDNYSKYEYSYNLTNKPGKWYVPTTRNIEVKSKASSGEMFISSYSSFAFVREIGKTEYESIELRREKPSYKLDYPNQLLYLDKGAYYTIYSKNTQTGLFDYTNSSKVCTEGNVNVKELFQSALNNEGIQYYIKVYNLYNSTLLSSPETIITIDKTKIPVL